MSESIFYDLLKFIIPQIGILGLVYLFLEHWLKRDRIAQSQRRKDEFSQHILPNQIHAFERMVLFLERIAPNNIVPRLNQPQLSAQELQYVLTNEISVEFEHNLSQQLYIPNQTWQKIVLAKDQSIQTIIQATQALPEGSSSKDLAVKLLSDRVYEDKSLITTEVIGMLKKDLYSIINT